MKEVRRAEERGHADHGWLQSHFSFSFADYYDPRFMGFRTLRVINDDIVAPGMGFGAHPHRDMEIITYILSGELEHKDSMGNGRIIKAGEFQYMAAGRGVKHSEFNPSKTEPVHLLQMWILPDESGLPSRYEERSAANAPVGKLTLIASKDGRDASIKINQDANLLLARLGVGNAAAHALGANRHAWVHVAEGEMTVNGERLRGGDGIALSGEEKIELAGVTNAQALIFDMN
jgi:quercetin 2,3-dioxygenase